MISNHPSDLIFNESHTMQLAINYIKKIFYIDRDPPFAGMFYSLFIWILGHLPFNFYVIKKSHSFYRAPLIPTRLFSSVFGVLLSPITYLTLRVMRFTRNTSILGSILIIFENSVIVQSRYLLSDSLALFFIALTHLFWRLFESCQQIPFRKAWWTYLIATGFSLGALISTKWVGVFTFFWIGLLACLQLWHFIEDLTMTLTTWIKHFSFRFFSLIIIPAAFYIITFYFHINLLKNADENVFLSPEFLSTFDNRNFKPVPATVFYGSTVTIRHLNSPYGYLHSHFDSYPSGSKQQQVTLYLYKDSNNNWLITDSGDKEHEIRSFSTIPDGSIIRLYHLETRKRLHSHDVRPPLSDVDWQNEVSGYGHEGFPGDYNDFFRIEIDKSRSYTDESKSSVRAIETKFRLIHVATGCALFSNNIYLPEWGHGQIEVTCAKDGIYQNSLWYIEDNNYNNSSVNIEKVSYKKISFFQKFFELHTHMWEENFNPENSYNAGSHPLSWLFLRRGIHFWIKKKDQIYFLGNPLIWLLTVVFVGVYGVFKVFVVLSEQRGYPSYNDKVYLRYDYFIGTSLFGWIFHYFPYYFMQKRFLLSHYIPAFQAQQKLYPATIFTHKRIGCVEMPSNLVKSVQDIIESSYKSNTHLSVIKMNLSRGFQKVKSNFSEIEEGSYLFCIMPQVYASLYNVINKLRLKLGDNWVPETVLDCGEGPGIGALVFQELFSNSIEKVKSITVLEPKHTMRKHTLYIHKANKVKIISDSSSIMKLKFDFIIANHIILDTNVPEHVFTTHIRKLWAKVSPENGILLLLERGNPLGYQAIAKARKIILSNTDSDSRKSQVTNVGHVISPCPHDKQCPLYLDGNRLNPKKWCHFGQRLIRPVYLQKIKHSASNIENSKFSYCIIQKEIVRSTLEESEINFTKDRLSSDHYNWHRLILPPLKKHGHVIMDTCVSDGTVKRMIISKKHGKLHYQNVRKAYWGDLWALNK
ncbi:hypothetical protein MERGE_001858 [Pneumocystis wakefieldiae]|uniref:Dolichyl-phosphate-mannose--protein mannosyltransferase n=1 Tax=Pneumocystis wakefieldiae TaxID=38082 RepID=A0A899G7L7_9ASCO|nr:hypothetical protein MERGE_001858 [Pneumocystis wakefieldiae]